MPRPLALLRLARAGNAAISASGAAVGAFLAAGWPFPLAPTAAAMGAAFAFAAAGNVRNDIGDVDVDRVAHPRRPLVTGDVSLRAARMLVVALYAIAIACGALVSWWGLALVIAALPVMEAYERWGKAGGFPGNAIIGLLTGAPFVLGSVAATGGLTPVVLAVAGLAALATVGREILKDVEDEGADRGRRLTLPMRIGRARAALVAALFLVAAVALSPAPWLLEKVLGVSYVVGVAVADAAFLGAAFVGRSRPGLGQRLAKLGMVLALAALVAGRYQGGSA